MDPKILSKIMHEIRAPLTAIRGYISLLSEGSFGKIPEESKEVLEKLHVDVIKTIYRINDFSALLKCENEHEEELQKNESVNLMQFMNLIVDSYKTEEEKAVEVEYEISGDESIQVKVPVLPLKFVLSFLLKHATRVSKKGSRINIQILKKDNLCQILIKDAAPKIGNENIKFLFEPFSEKGDVEGSSGLELFNCQKATNYLPDAKIGVLPDYDHGNTYYISLPFNN